MHRIGGVVEFTACREEQWWCRFVCFGLGSRQFLKLQLKAECSYLSGTGLAGGLCSSASTLKTVGGGAAALQSYGLLATNLVLFGGWLSLLRATRACCFVVAVEIFWFYDIRFVKALLY